MIASDVRLYISTKAPVWVLETSWPVIPRVGERIHLPGFGSVKILSVHYVVGSMKGLCEVQIETESFGDVSDRAYKLIHELGWREG